MSALVDGWDYAHFLVFFDSLPGAPGLQEMNHWGVVSPTLGSIALASFFFLLSHPLKFQLVSYNLKATPDKRAEVPACWNSFCVFKLWQVQLLSQADWTFLLRWGVTR